MKDFKQFRLGSAVYLLIVVLSACAAFGLAPPQTFNQRLAYSYGSVTSVREVAKNLLEAGKISVPEAKDVQAKADNAREVLDLSRQFNDTGDVKSAESKLALAQKVLGALQSYLESKGGNL